MLLQKEQSLLTRPTASGYERATGYGCPDTADCDQKYFGFFNQVYNAAWQFRQYTEEPDRASTAIGTVDVGYHPDAACGASPVEIRNQATANLYNYTPYQPSDATLADPDTGDACSAFGNLNFWRIWHRWFGDPRSSGCPRSSRRARGSSAGIRARRRNRPSRQPRPPCAERSDRAVVSPRRPPVGS